MVCAGSGDRTDDMDATISQRLENSLVSILTRGLTLDNDGPQRNYGLQFRTFVTSASPPPCD
jgi:hypothetical protein